MPISTAMGISREICLSIDLSKFIDEQSALRGIIVELRHGRVQRKLFFYDKAAHFMTTEHIFFELLERFA